jgi:hypothetical protein
MFVWITWMWIGIDFDLVVGLCITGASRSDVKTNKQNMAAAFVLLFQNERAIHRERIFRDRTQNLDTLSDSELICRYRFSQIKRTILIYIICSVYL